MSPTEAKKAVAVVAAYFPSLLGKDRTAQEATTRAWAEGVKGYRFDDAVAGASIAARTHKWVSLAEWCAAIEAAGQIRRRIAQNAESATRRRIAPPDAGRLRLRTELARRLAVEIVNHTHPPLDDDAFRQEVNQRHQTLLSKNSSKPRHR